MLISLTGTRDGTLSISMSEEFVQDLFPYIAEGSELVIFVDDVPVSFDFIQTMDERKGTFILEIPIEHGTEVVEIIGEMPL